MQPKTYVKKSSGKLPLKAADFTHPKLALVPRRVTRLYRNTTTEWIRLRWFDGTARAVITTPGHQFLDELGGFPTIEERARTGSAAVVLASGELTQVTAERTPFCADIAPLFERAMGQGGGGECGGEGGGAGWLGQWGGRAGRVARIWGEGCDEARAEGAAQGCSRKDSA